MGNLSVNRKERQRGCSRLLEENRPAIQSSGKPAAMKRHIDQKEAFRIDFIDCN